MPLMTISGGREERGGIMEIQSIVEQIEKVIDCNKVFV